MPKSDEVRALEAIAKALGSIERALVEVRDELRSQRRDAQRPGR